MLIKYDHDHFFITIHVMSDTFNTTPPLIRCYVIYEWIQCLHKFLFWFKMFLKTKQSKDLMVFHWKRHLFSTKSINLFIIIVLRMTSESIHGTHTSLNGFQYRIFGHRLYGGQCRPSQWPKTLKETDPQREMCGHYGQQGLASITSGFESQIKEKII